MMNIFNTKNKIKSAQGRGTRTEKGPCGKLAAAALTLTAAAVVAVCSAAHTADFGVLTAYAAASDYHIGSCDWEYGDGTLSAVWDETAEKTQFVIDVYKGSIKDSSKVRKTSITTSSGAESYDLSRIVAEKGTGNYYYTIYPKKGGTGLMVVSEAFEVDSDILSEIKTALNYKKISITHPNAGKAINLEVQLGWKQNPNGTWRYRLSQSSYAKSQWLNINGKWYYFGADGIMLTGWQQINGLYYYFNKDGDLVQGNNAASSSGGSGTLSNNNLSSTNTSVLSKSDVGNVTYTSGTKNISNVTVSFTETDTTPGTVRPMTITVPSNVTLVSTYYSKQPETWSPGTTVEITLTLKAADGSQFGSGCKIRGSNATYKSQSGDAFTRTVKFEYVAKTRLAQVQKVYLDDSYVMHWSKVSNASGYSVKIYFDEEYEVDYDNDFSLFTEDEETGTLTRSRTKSISVKQNQLDVTDYIEIDEISNVKFVITAQAASSRRSYYLDSAGVTFTDSQGIVTSSNETGSITSNNKGDMLYIGTDGTGITGWQDIDGAWYYFESKGVAAGPGWKRIDKEWYYFGEDHKMQTGWLQTGGYWYYLNESTTSGTYGAMLTGSQTINGTTYMLNIAEGSQGKPLGAWIE